ncbi:Clp protease N-terminal domain-containing protein [Deinococcus koreensis]|uniref:Clp R domain-containing protein n=1 Tax=Deinococcus koreensis TaxID=2054903 RepID=A0A2K3UUF1_9DEIO|nr:Clp protease N-terminal domain-containing protein [Deinococcus koreensis]PNY80164.1 hypothetical protein CVO96_01260 [Deinococcus koreensis]
MQRYDDRARLVFHFAREESEATGEHRVSPAHLLLALLRTEGGAGELLAAAGASLTDWRGALKAQAPAGPRPSSDAPMITPDARRVMETAAELARRQRSVVVAPQHILLALLTLAQKEAAGDLRRLLARLPTPLEVLRERVLALPLPAADSRREGLTEESLRALREMIQRAQEADFRSPEVPSRAEILGIILTSGAEPLLGDLEPLVYGRLTGETVDEAEKHLLLTQLLALALHRSA